MMKQNIYLCYNFLLWKLFEVFYIYLTNIGQYRIEIYYDNKKVLSKVATVLRFWRGQNFNQNSNNLKFEYVKAFKKQQNLQSCLYVNYS